MTLIRSLCRLHDGLTDAGYIAGALALAAMATIYCYEVVTRYFIGVATDWANDTFSNLLIVCVFGMVPHATRVGQHIAIGLLGELIPSWRKGLFVLTCVLGCAVCAFAAWMSVSENIRVVEQQIVTEQNHPLPKILMSAWISFGFIGATLYFLRILIPHPAVEPKSWVAPRREIVLETD